MASFGATTGPGELEMKSILVAAIIAGMMVPACAQGMSGGMGGGLPGGRGHHGLKQKSEQPKRKVDEKAYKSALDKLPDKKFDPWQGVREQPQAK